MDLALRLHPDSVSGSVTGVRVEVSRLHAEIVTFKYLVTGTIADLVIPPPAPPARRDGLWQNTCLEAFARVPGDAAYREFNFSPSGEWAAYGFSGYRAGMKEEAIIPPGILTRTDPDRFELEATLELGAAPLQLALSAVIEEKNGRKSYWALAHPAGKADFHHPDSFVHEIPCNSE